MQKNLGNGIVRTAILKRILVYSLLFLFLGTLQCAFFPLLDFCPATPDLIMTALLAILLLDSNAAAMTCAVCAGFFIDAIGASSLALSPIIYFLFVAIIGTFSGKMLKSLASFAILLAPSALFRAVATYICIFASERALPHAFVFTDILLPEALMTVLLAVPVYFLTKLCTVPLEARGKFTF